MKYSKETEFQKIVRKTGRKPVSCKCVKCKSQCAVTPCLGTPQDIMALVDAGYADVIYPTDWKVGQMMGITDKVVPMFQLEQRKDGSCVLFKDGLCTIHEKGLKPTEGKLSHHSYDVDNFVAKKSLGWNIAKTWMDEDNGNLIELLSAKVERCIHGNAGDSCSVCEAILKDMRI